MDHDEQIQETFTADQRIRLAAALHLKSEQEIDAAVSAVAGTVLAYYLGLAAKNMIPRRVKSKKKLLQIADAARKLKTLLRDFDISVSIGNHIESSEIVPPHVAKMFHRRPLWSDDEVNVLDMLSMLTNIDINATCMAKSDAVFGYYYMLPSTREANRDFNAHMLWPRLFKFWELAGNGVAATPGGPTFRFLCLIHEVAEIDPPEPGSLRSACERWLKDPMRARVEEIPWRS